MKGCLAYLLSLSWLSGLKHSFIVDLVQGRGLCVSLDQGVDHQILAGTEVRVWTELWDIYSLYR